MTNHPVDFKNADAILVCGNNPAENHPLAMRWIVEAMEKRGAPLIVVDPRFNRTASMATHFLRIRPGTDIAFFGGLIRHAIEKGAIQREYVAQYTNAGFLLKPEFRTATDLDGIFPGLTLETLDGNTVKPADGKAAGVDWAKVKGGKYDKASWAYDLYDPKKDAAAAEQALATARAEGGSSAKVEPWGNLLVDRTLTHPRSVFQQMRRHYDRYTPERVSAVTGAPVEELTKIWDLWIARTAAPEKTGGVMYAMGQTQSTIGVQKIRVITLAQLLFGNIGLAGGGVNAMRGHANVQGASDNPTLYNLLPGYLKPPTAAQQDWATYLKETTPPKLGDEKQSLNWWGNTPKYAVSLWKAWWRDAFDEKTGAGYEYMPKLDARSYGFIDLFHEMQKGKIEGLYLFGMNPAVGGPNARQIRVAMRKLKWLVAADLYETESAAVWKPESDEGVDPAKIDTEVFLLPAASPYEKGGSFTNTGRWIQWRDPAVAPYGDARSDSHMINEIFWELRELYEKEGGVYPDPILRLAWDYTAQGPYVRTAQRTQEMDLEAVAREINGYALTDFTDEKTSKTVKAGEQLPMFTFYRDDGTTAGGDWIYAGYYSPAGNVARARDGSFDPTGKGFYPKWGWSWPANRRIIYNRAGVDTTGTPWSADHAAITWDATAQNPPDPKTGKPVPPGKWVGDVPDGAGGPGAISPFIMRNEGVGRLWGNGLADAPFPEHYEPFESPVKNPLSSMQNNPVVKRWDNIEPTVTKIARFGTGDTEKYPYVLSTWRLTEHHLTGQMSRNARMLAQLQPELMIEISPDLAKIEGIDENDLVAVESVRGRIVARARITPRQRPMQVAGKTLHVVGMPFHWGYKGYVTGHVANDLLHDLYDPNAQIQEDKHLLVRLAKPTRADLDRYQAILAQAQYNRKSGREG